MFFGAMAPEGGRNFYPFLYSFAACSATYVVSHIIASQLKSRPKKDVIADADLIFSLPMYFGLSYLSLKGAIMEDWSGDYEVHWFKSDGTSRHFTLMYAAMNLVHIPITLFKNQDLTYKILMTLHHMLSITCMLGGLANDRMYFFAALDGACETSTFLLTTLFVFKTELFSSGPITKMLTTINGVLLWIFYLVFRIFLFPTWLYIFVTEAMQHKDKTWDVVNPHERYMYPTVTLILLGLSTLWFIQITKGMLKAINCGSKKSKKA